MANIELPKDAEGHEIPLDTKLLYDKEGNPKEVSIFAYTPRSYSSGWSVVLVGGFERFASAMFLNPPEPPDSWEKLEEDLRRGADAERYPMCKYANGEEFLCSECRFLRGEGCCARVNEALADILGRIRKLRGEGE